MTQNTTTEAIPATITEKELFTVFAGLPVQVRNGFGTIKHSALAHEYTPQDYMRSWGYEELSSDITDMLADGLLADEHPEDSLQNLIDELEGYACQLSIVLRDFRVFKDMHSIEPDLPNELPADAEPEAVRAWAAAWAEWDENARFRTPRVKVRNAA